MRVIKGSGMIALTDYKEIMYIGETKNGAKIKIIVKNAINMENIDFTLKEKDDIVPKLTFTGCWDDSVAEAENKIPPYEIQVEDAGYVDTAEGIALGAGAFYIGEDPIALCRGGGKFTVEREFRPIKADGDRGLVKGRIALEGETPKLEMNVLTFLGRMTDLYPGTSVSTVAE